MAIISYDDKEVILFVPEYHENREDKEPCVVGIKYVSHGRATGYANKIAERVRVKTKGVNLRKDFGLLAEVQLEVDNDIREEQFLENVKSVKGFKNSSGKDITDIAEFYSKIDDELKNEIISAMVSMAKLTEGQRDNFLSQSVGG